MDGLNDLLTKVITLDEEAMTAARNHWDNIAKPIHSLARLEELVVRLAGILQTPQVKLPKRALVVMCADNGVVAEGVAAAGSEVTSIVAAEIAAGGGSVSCMSRIAGVEIIPVDIGINGPEIEGLLPRRVTSGTQNMVNGPAMSKDEARRAARAGMELVRDLKDRGFSIIATGEMGIGNTTTSSAVASVLLREEADRMTGRGTGITDEGLCRKIDVIKKAIAFNQPDPSDVWDVLAKVGGLDIAGLCGVFLGGAVYRVPVIIDGYISAVAALAACRLQPRAALFMLPSHLSAEPGAAVVLQALDLQPIIHAGMCLGEGTGAVALLPLLDMALAVYNEASTLDSANIDSYKPGEEAGQC